MDAGTRRLFVATLAAVIVVSAASVFLLSDDGDRAGGPLGATSVDGVIVAVDAAGLADVRGFTLRLVNGATMDFRLDRLENGTAFPPGHLAEHQATAEPVRVWYSDEAGTRYAIRVDDAPR